MKIYYSRVNGTNDGVNGSALQRLLENMNLQSLVEILRWTNDRGVYSFDKLDSADVMIIGYKEDNHNVDAGFFEIGKGVYNEVERAHSKGIPVFWLNLAQEELPYLENIREEDLVVTDETNYKEYGYLSVHKSYGYMLQMKIDTNADRLINFFNDCGCTISTESISLSNVEPEDFLSNTPTEIVESNKLLLLLLR